MTTLFAQPYDLSANGFYFENAEEYGAKANALRNDYGQPVEEFEIQFIDGEDLDCDLAKAIGLNQVNTARFLELADEWGDDQKTRYILAVGECGYQFDLDNDNPDDLDVDIYQLDTMRDLAEQFVDEGLCGEIPEGMRYYFDYDAYARDLAMDYSDATINGTRIIYRCG
ncbi:TPA: antirestriction protein ArdA [Candidatus Poribacteria bacterium]|nr:antirestriction protein ArdA [Candidatus Poribacteria bacterium]